MLVTKNVSNCLGGAGFDRVILFSLFVLLGLAFLQPLHAQPNPTYLEDFALGLGVLFLVGILMTFRCRFYLNKLVLVWLCFGGLLVVSLSIANLSFLSQLNMYGGFWLVGLGVAQLGANYSWLRRDDYFSIFLSRALFYISLLSAFGGIVRLYSLGGLLSFYIPMPPVDRMIGLQGQSNYFAVVGLLGFFASSWLYSKGLLSKFRYVFAISLLCYGMILSGTRVIYVIYISFLLSSYLIAWKAKDYRLPKAVLFSGACYLSLMPVTFFVNDWFVDFLKFYGFNPLDGVGSSIFRRGLDSSARFVEWKVASSIILNSFPWGVGPGGYPAASYDAHLSSGLVPVLGGLFTHSHNSYLQIVAEFGVLGFVWLIVAGWVVLAVLKAAYDNESSLIMGVLLSLLIYSFFEFPLWVMHFFVLFFLILAGGQKSSEVNLWRISGFMLSVISCYFLIYYLSIFYGVFLAHLAKFDGRSDTDYSYVNKMMRDPLLEHFGYVTYLTSPTYQLSRVDSDLILLERFRSFLPYSAIMARYSITLAGSGRREKAVMVRDELLRFDPDYKSSFLDNVDFAEGMIKEWDIKYLKNF